MNDPTQGLFTWVLDSFCECEYDSINDIFNGSIILGQSGITPDGFIENPVLMFTLSCDKDQRKKISFAFAFARCK